MPRCSREPCRGAVSWRPLLLVTVAGAAFGFLIAEAGLVIALTALVVLSALASTVLALGATLGLAVLFFGLNGIFFWLPTLYRRAIDLEAGMAGTLTAGITLVGKRARVPRGVEIGRNCRIDPDAVERDFARRRLIRSGETIHAGRATS